MYNTSIFLEELVLRLEKTISKLDKKFEVIFVDDGSPDDAWDRVEKLAQSKDCIKGIKLSRNFGQHYAISAGLDRACGEWIVVMDGDLQDQPEEIENLYRKALQGYAAVFASRQVRHDSVSKKMLSRLFYRLLSYLTGSKHDETVANFGIYNYALISTVVAMRESIRYFPTMVKWTGFKTVKIPVAHAPRSSGKSSYNIKRLVNLALDIMLAYSDKPLRLTLKFGLAITFLSFLAGMVTIYQWSQGKIEVLGYSSIVISIWFFGGTILFILGVLGLYIGKIFEGVKNRPIYIVEKFI